MPNNASQPEAELEQIVLRNAQKLYKTALAVTGNRADAEEIAQECFVRLMESDPELDSPEHETAWLVRVAVNLCKNRLKSGWYRKTVPLTGQHPAQDENELSLMETVARLPAKDRAVIHLYYYEGYRTGEIARILCQKESTVRSRLARARQKLRELIEEEKNGRGPRANFRPYNFQEGRNF